MKKRLISLALVVLMLLSIVPTAFAAEYVLPDVIKNDSELMQDLDVYGGWPMGEGGYANLWYVYEGKADGADWPQEYRDIFETAIDEAGLGGEYTLYDYEWQRNTITVDFGVTFDVKYYWQVGISYTELYGPVRDDYTNGLAIAITDNDGNLIRVISDDGADFVPELRYDQYNAYNTLDWQCISLEDALAFEEKIGMEKEYTSECRQTVSITLPGDFDPELYNITLYFESHEDTMAFMDSAPRFSTPFEVEYEHDYFLTYPEVGGNLDMLYTLADAAPAEVCDYFEALIEAETDCDAGEYMYPYNLSVLDDVFTFSMNTGGSIFANYMPPYTSSEEIVHVKDVHLIAAVRDKISGDILSVEKWGRHVESSEVFTDVKLDLPDFYDYERHEVVFFRYTLDFYPEGDYSRPSDVPEVSVSWVMNVAPQEYIFGDANKDLKVNIADVSAMLKYIAGWDGIDKVVPSYVFDIPESALKKEDCFYNMPMVSVVLKRIAGWEGVKEIDSRDLARCSGVIYYYK